MIRRRLHRLAAALALAAMASPAAASPCWGPALLGAARISELNTLLMTSTLRCKRTGINFSASYEKVLSAHAAAFKAAEARLRAHFGIDHSDSADDYDSYVVSIANFYGGGRADPATCWQLGAIASTLGNAAGDAELLASIAIQMIRDPRTGPHCPAAQRAKPAPASR